MGGTGTDYGMGIAVDGTGNVYLAGYSYATWGSPMRSYAAGADVFAAKLDGSGNLAWNTFLGGTGTDYGQSVAVDGAGSLYVAGNSDAIWGSPVRGHSGNDDGFAARLDGSGNLTWNTFLGSTDSDYGMGIALDGTGDVYLAGYSLATWGSPVRAYTIGADAFAAKLDGSGNLTWETFLGGGSGYDVGLGIAVDGAGDVYVAGYSSATWGSPVRAYTIGADAFAAKLDGSGNLAWNTFLGGTSSDLAYDVAVDGTGNVYVTGYSGSTWGSPVRGHSGNDDVFAAKLDGSGNLTWNTFIGGTGSDHGNGIAVDGAATVYVAGYSTAAWGSPVRGYSGKYDGFAAKLDGSGNLAWNTFLGGTGDDEGYDIAIDGAGNIYVTGDCDAAWGTPVRPYAAAYDAFAAKLDGSGNLAWNTFLGGTDSDYGIGIAVDGTGNVYLVGYSLASWGSPVRAYSAAADVFGAKLDGSGNLVWNTFLGDTGSDYGYGIAVDVAGSVNLAGRSTATWGSPVRAYKGGEDAFAAVLDGGGNLAWNTFLGGTGYDYGYDIAVDGSGNIYVGGFSNAPWGSPVRGYTGGSDAFAAKVRVVKDASAVSLDDPASGGTKYVGVAFSPQATFGAGTVPLTNVPVRYRIVGPAPSTAEVYNQTSSVPTLNCGAWSQVIFPGATIATAGDYTIYARAELPGDEVPSNDEISGPLSVLGPPPEVAPGTTPSTALTWTDKTTLTWPTETTATIYNLYRGTPADLPQLLNASIDSCSRYAGAANSIATITELPAAGSFYWYLITGGNPAGEGPAGNATTGPRVVDSSGGCP